MKLRNFKLEEPAHAIAVEGCGYYWDLHSYADLVEIKYSTVENSVEFHWSAPEIENPWGDESNRAKGLILRFSDVRLLEIVQMEAYNTNEDDTVASVSKVNPTKVRNGAPVEFRMKDNWNEGEDFGLFFELQSGRTIEIHATSAELIPI